MAAQQSMLFGCETTRTIFKATTDIHAFNSYSNPNWPKNRRKHICFGHGNGFTYLEEQLALNGPWIQMAWTWVLTAMLMSTIDYGQCVNPLVSPTGAKLLK
jgi:hypothetical protein